MRRTTTTTTTGTGGGGDGPQRQRQRLLDVAGVAELLNVPERHVRRLVSERRIPFLKWGHLLRFDPAAVGAWLDAARIPPHEGSGRPSR